MRKRPYVVPIVGKITQEPYSLLAGTQPKVITKDEEDNNADAKLHNFYDEETEESKDPWGNVKFN